MTSTRLSGQAGQEGTNDRRTRAALTLRSRSMLLAFLFLAATAVDLLLLLGWFFGEFLELLLGRGSLPAGVVMYRGGFYGLGVLSATVAAVATFDRARRRRVRRPHE